MIPALANHLWQSTAFAILAALLTLALCENRPRIRHTIWFAASLKFLIPWSFLIALGSRIHWQSAPAQPALTVVLDQVSQPFPGSPVLSAAPRTPDPLPMILFAIWAIGFIGIALAWAIRWKRMNALARNATPLDLDLPIGARSTPDTMEPGIFGIFRPVLLLPEGIAARLTPEQLRAVIDHELCHVSHRDNLTAAIQMFIETVFWFHPLVWWIGKRMIAERELACDEEVVKCGSDPRIYAEGILTVCKLYQESPLICAAGVTGADLKTRIQAILAGRIAREMTFARKIVLATVIVLAVTTPLLVGILHASTLEAFERAIPRPKLRMLVPPPPPPPPHLSLIAQLAPAPSPPLPIPAPPLTFEAASIKAIVGLWGAVGVSPSGSRITFEAMTVGNLISWAYDVKEFQVLGGPEWTGSQSRYDSATRFNIEAKADGAEPRTPGQFKQMIRALLAERFHLTIHRDSKQMPVYALVVDKAGPKLKESGPDSPHAAQVFFPGRTGARIISQGQTIGFLAGQLRASGMDRPVIDETHLTGSYDYTLDFERPDVQSNGESMAPSIFTAMKEQLGLRLESKNAPVEVLIIDAVEKPDAN